MRRARWAIPRTAESLSRKAEGTCGEERIQHSASVETPPGRPTGNVNFVLDIRNKTKPTCYMSGEGDNLGLGLGFRVRV